MITELFEVKSSRNIQASRFEIVEDELSIDGRPALYSYVKIKPGICVIIEVENKYVVLKEYRYPIKQWSYEFAAGIIDESETPEQAAVREVKEETGYVTDIIQSLGEFYPSFGATDEVIHLFYAKCSTQMENEQEYTEFISYENMTEKELERLFTDGTFKHGAGIAAWLRYKLSIGNL